MKNLSIVVCIACLLVCPMAANGQGEHVGALQYKPFTSAGVNHQPRASAKGTALGLPYFEDFTQEGFSPDTNRWMDAQVYINNSMGVNPVSRGVATFDALAADGLPYEKLNKTISRYADSLTSRTIDLSGYSAADSVYFSFFYQPQGNGFDPQPQDSLMLYFHRASTSSPWTRVWRVPGGALQPFQQVMIPITDANFFNSEFQFRFVNKASVNNADDNWNIDYIRIGANRNINDTGITDVAYVAQTSFMLNDYTYMPHHQFNANPAGERAAEFYNTIRNNTGTPQNVAYGYEAKELFTNTPLGVASNSSVIPANTEATVALPLYTNTLSVQLPNALVRYENKFYLSSGVGGSVENDTIVCMQEFSNYLAYDDGSPEKSYYLDLFATLPGKLAIEYELNVPDSITGIAIYFGRQVPLAYQKYFSAVVYSSIGVGTANEQVLYQQDLLIPDYLPGNQFWKYKFDKKVGIPAGKFYIGTTQPALGSSDSLYFGLDVQRTATNHLFYNVLNEWKASGIQGAVMIRPLFGQFFPSDIPDARHMRPMEWSVFPSPAAETITISTGQPELFVYEITDLQGKLIKRGMAGSKAEVPVGELSPGMYMVNMVTENSRTTPKKFVKM